LQGTAACKRSSEEVLPKRLIVVGSFHSKGRGPELMGGMDGLQGFTKWYGRGRGESSSPYLAVDVPLATPTW